MHFVRPPHARAVARPAVPLLPLLGVLWAGFALATLVGIWAR
ncbi:MAG: hypothetical protein QM704_27280 [Anaeromyxobacteraceae bacterium]